MRKLTYRINKAFSSNHSAVCVIGGGAAGLNFASHYAKLSKEPLTIFQPSAKHYYHSGFTMLATGLCNDSLVVKDNSDVFSNRLTRVTKAIKSIQPSKNQLQSSDGQVYTYDQLILATGGRDSWDHIKGAQQALDDPDCPVVSVYTHSGALKIKRIAESFKGGKAVFTQAQKPAKCRPVAQMIMYLLADKWPSRTINFRTPEQTLSDVPKYAQSLAKVAGSYGINTHFKERIIEIKKDERKAVFQNIATGALTEQAFDFLHICPALVAPSIITEAGLNDSHGFVDVDMHTMQSKVHHNVWSLGDVSNLPTEKTAAAIYTQTDVLIKNVKQQFKKEQPVNLYDGYSSCPIFVGRKKVMLTEFKYNGVVDESFSPTQEVPSWFYYALTKDFFPFAYWKFVPRGQWLGKDGIRTW